MKPPERAARWRSHCAVALVSLLAMFSLWSTAVVEVCAASLIVCLGVLHRREIPGIVLSLPFVLWALYVVGVILSIVFSSFPEDSGRYSNYLWHAALFPLLLVHPWSTRDLEIVSLSFATSAAIAAGSSLVLFFLQDAAYAAPLSIGLTTWSALLALAGLVSLSKSLLAESSSRIMWIVAYVLVCAALLFSARFTGSLALMAGSVVLILLLRPRALVLWVMVVLLLGALSPEALYIKWSWIVGGGETDRYILWRAGIDLLAQIPFFGFGPFSYERILPAEVHASFAYHPPASWHSDFLQIFLESGWLIGMVYVSGIAILFMVVLRGMGSGVRTRSGITEATLFGTMLLFAAVDSVVSTAVLGVVWWLILGGVTKGLMGRRDDRSKMRPAE